MPVTTFDPHTATAKQITCKIVALKKTGQQWQETVQLVGLACIVQIEEHNNATPANALYKALPEGARRTALGLWFARYGALTAATGKTKGEIPLKREKDAQPDFQAAAHNPWYSIKTEPPLKQALDAEKALATLLARLLKAEQVKNPEVVQRLKKAFPELIKAKAQTKKASAVKVLPALPHPFYEPVPQPNEAAVH